MEAFQRLIDLLKGLFTWWFFVQPWERGLRVRWGNQVVLCLPGTHFKIPGLDVVYVHNTRARMIDSKVQTLSSRDRQVFSVSVSACVAIGDVLKLHTTAHEPEPLIMQRVMAAIAQYVAARDAAQIEPKGVQEAASSIDVSDYGLVDLSVTILSFAQTPVFRIIQDNFGGLYTNTSINTIAKHGT